MNSIKKVALLLLLVGLSGISIPLNANDITITNKSPNSIAVIFTAAGCLGMSLGQSVVCKSDTKVLPNSSASYTWKWIQSSRKVKIKDSDYFFQLTKDPKGTYSWTGYTGDKGKEEAWRNKKIVPENKDDFKYLSPAVGIGI